MAFRKEEGQCGWHWCKAGDEDGAEGQRCHSCDLWEKWVASNIIAKTSDPRWLVFTNLGKLGKESAGEETAFWQVVFSAIPDHFILPIKFKHPIPEKLALIYKWQNLEGMAKCKAFSPSLIESEFEPNYFPSRLPGSQEVPAWNTQAFSKLERCDQWAKGTRHMCHPILWGQAINLCLVWVNEPKRMSFEMKLINHAQQQCVSTRPNWEGSGSGSSFTKARWYMGRRWNPLIMN